MSNIEPTSIATARVATSGGRRYIAQLGKHWAHSLVVAEDGDTRTITFPRDARGASWAGDAIVTLAPDDEGIAITIAASEDAQRDALKGAVASHIDRFAFREAPLSYDWHDG